MNLVFCIYIMDAVIYIYIYVIYILYTCIYILCIMDAVFIFVLNGREKILFFRSKG